MSKDQSATRTEELPLRTSSPRWLAIKFWLLVQVYPRQLGITVGGRWVTLSELDYQLDKFWLGLDRPSLIDRVLLSYLAVPFYQWPFLRHLAGSGQQQESRADAERRRSVERESKFSS